MSVPVVPSAAPGIRLRRSESNGVVEQRVPRPSATNLCVAPEPSTNTKGAQAGASVIAKDFPLGCHMAGDLIFAHGRRQNRAHIGRRAAVIRANAQRPRPHLFVGDPVVADHANPVKLFL